MKMFGDDGGGGKENVQS